VPPALRRAQILERIRRDGGATVAELTRAHAVSPVTVHRDLEELASKGLVERVHGGARDITRAGAAPTTPTAWSERADRSGAAKAAIAVHAARFVTSGATVFLDASSSALALARRLMLAPPDAVTLVTNSPAIAYEVVAETLHVVVCPGELDQHTRAVTGRWTVEFLHALNVDVAFFSVAGVTLDGGLSTSRRALADVLGAARRVASQSVGLIDSTKFGRSSLITIARAQDLDALITDDGLEPATAEAYRRGGVRLQVAGAERAGRVA
jgi:DeoR family fructose operon transcriptional repressor